MHVTYDFTGRTVVITGAGRGIGLAAARFFHSAGAVVWLVGRDGARLKEAADSLDGARFAEVDVTRTQEVDTVVSDVISDTGRIDILINNAGILRDRMIWNLTDEDWDSVLSVHLGGPFRFIRASVPHFRRQGWGRVVNVTSYAGMHGNVGQTAYSAAKSGIIGLTKTAAKELVRFGVTVNAISPVAETRMITALPDEQRERLQDIIPAGYFAPAAEISWALAYLASDQAGYVTGTVLPVDGGMSI
ncbi:3-oxoacyl-[acyl-carrier protein] reductase [Streptomyces phaeochromogenes]|uniref:SDR family oxidoreductase n=1 Tax=Streptomyces phaeochromogenes TaxID=1923 RepID=UPI00279506B3|nr:SDR family NAD(P)-dependent oxidoreductase [Streptomyces phaeochromogenes]MDQ0948595.1 3-oxoacyl-[acyl-carrier protein] reductase [Streptomyces phaeochromogenes]